MASSQAGGSGAAAGAGADADAHGAQQAQQAPKHTNRLAQEESPYLLQHAHNPVDWYPWGEEAFAKARREDKPIFLSVGYSTCHWCHVMERESFESEQVAALMNQLFVNVKVDREERPDVDKVYMTYVQATQGGGGWPMSCFLTPELRPFLGGTYFPPEDAHGRPGFKTLLKNVHRAWERQKAAIRASSADAMAQLAKLTAPEGSAEPLADTEAAKILDKCAAQLGGRFDAKLGGFGGAPKFPRPSEINALLVEHLRAGAAGGRVEAGKALEMALFTLQRMAAGGMYDHVGGGFHRYSVDEYWHVPHFEKMLYDNPQLAHTYLHAFALTGDGAYARTARGVLDYLRRDMTHPQGGLYSAEDADSADALGRKKEGAFYLWTAAEVDQVLGPDRAPVFKSHYYVKARGNADLSPRSDPHHEFRGLNCLIQIKSLAATAKEHGLTEAEAEAVLAKSRELLHARRAQRPRPHLDDKVVAGWNGMAIGAFAAASRVLAGEDPPQQRSFPVEGVDRAEYLAAAVRAAEFAHSQLWDADTARLRRSFCRAPSAVQAFADDYAYLVAGLLDLYSAGGGRRWLEWALQLQRVQDDLFWDEAAGGYYATAAGDPAILLRMKDDYDGAEPAASSIAASNLFRLAALSAPEQAEQHRERGAATTAAFRERLRDMPLAMPQMCCALYQQALGPPRQVVVAGRPGEPGYEALLDAVHASFAPDKAVVLVDPGDPEDVAFWERHNPAALAMARGGGGGAAKARSGGGAPAAAVYICQNFTCKAPTSDPAKVRALLGETHAPGPVWYPADLQQADLSALRAPEK